MNLILVVVILGCNLLAISLLISLLVLQKKRKPTLFKTIQEWRLSVSSIFSDGHSSLSDMNREISSYKESIRRFSKSFTGDGRQGFVDLGYRLSTSIITRMEIDIGLIAEKKKKLDEIIGMVNDYQEKFASPLPANVESLNQIESIVTTRTRELEIMVTRLKDSVTLDTDSLVHAVDFVTSHFRFLKSTYAVTGIEGVMQLLNSDQRRG